MVLERGSALLGLVGLAERPELERLGDDTERAVVAALVDEGPDGHEAAREVLGLGRVDPTDVLLDATHAGEAVGVEADRAGDPLVARLEDLPEVRGARGLHGGPAVAEGVHGLLGEDHVDPTDVGHRQHHGPDEAVAGGADRVAPLLVDVGLPDRVGGVVDHLDPEVGLVAAAHFADGLAVLGLARDEAPELLTLAPVGLGVDLVDEGVGDVLGLEADPDLPRAQLLREDLERTLQTDDTDFVHDRPAVTPSLRRQSIHYILPETGLQ